MSQNPNSTWGSVRTSLTHTVSAAALALAAAALAIVVVLIGVKLLGYPPIAVLVGWVKGATGIGLRYGRAYRLAASFKEACPLLLTGLAAAVAFRSGVLNIGAQGQYLLGAVALTAITTRFIAPGQPWIVMTISLLVGALAGGLWAGIAAVLERTRGVPVVLSTILLNFVAASLVTALLQGPLQDPTTSAPISASVPDAFQLPLMNVPHLGGFSEVLHRLHLGVPLALLLAVVTAIFLKKTTFGFELLIAGLNPNAARLAGVPVFSRQFAILLLSGCFAGLAGAIQVSGVTHDLSVSPSDYGYAGIAVALLGRLDPLGVVMAALFFGMLDNGASFVEKNPDLAVPHDVADITKGLVVLVMLVGTAWLSRRRIKIAATRLARLGDSR